MKNSFILICVSFVSICAVILVSACDKLPSSAPSAKKQGSSSVLAKSLNHAKNSIACDNHLRQLSMYCRNYREENGKTLSAGENALKQLIYAQNIPRQILSCPVRQNNAANSSSVYLFCGLGSSSSNRYALPVFFDKPGNHNDGSASVLLDSGEVVLLKGSYKSCYEILSALCVQKNYPAEISNYYKQMGTAFDQLYGINQ
jgi:hypothetical protein